MCAWCMVLEEVGLLHVLHLLRLVVTLAGCEVLVGLFRPRGRGDNTSTVEYSNLGGGSSPERFAQHHCHIERLADADVCMCLHGCLWSQCHTVYSV